VKNASIVQVLTLMTSHKYGSKGFSLQAPEAKPLIAEDQMGSWDMFI
jgi:hypothetical protein